METVPEWVTSYLEMWRRKLYLFEWEITTFISPHPDNDPEGVRAIVTLYPAILQANIVFKDDIPAMLEDVEPGEIRGWKKTIIHELVHIRLADITEYVQGDIFSELSPGAGSLAQKNLTRQVEPTVEILSEILLQLEEGVSPEYS